MTSVLGWVTTTGTEVLGTTALGGVTATAFGDISSAFFTLRVVIGGRGRGGFNYLTNKVSSGLLELNVDTTE